MDPRRTLPSIEALLQRDRVARLTKDYPRKLVVEAARRVVASARTAGVLDTAAYGWDENIEQEVISAALPSLRPVINASGVVLHTNLGRAPMAREAVAAMAQAAASYSNLEFDLAAGERGSRLEHCRKLLARLTGAEDAIVLNNAAGALVVALNSLAAGKAVVLSRGELIEIGGSFRIPDIIGRSGARLAEVGTTNRTHLRDYQAGLTAGERAGALLTVHRSNFQLTGFVTSPRPAELAQLGEDSGVPYIHDVGSGLLLDLSPWGLRGEPVVQHAVQDGAHLVVFSGDKLLGGPQAGCVVGRADLIDEIRRNPLARALRADKMTLAGLAATLTLYQDERTALERVPVIAMLTRPVEDIERAAGALASRCHAALRPSVISGESAVGGGSFPGCPLPTFLVALEPPEGAESFARRLRSGPSPVVARVTDDRVVLDPRTVLPGQTDELVDRLNESAG